MNFILIILGSFIGVLIADIILGGVNYLIKQHYLKKVGKQNVKKR